MSVMRPWHPSNSIRSPIRIGCETAIWIPAIMLESVRWAAKPTTATTSAVEARTPVASRFSSVNWLSPSIAKIRRTTRNARRRRIRSRVRVVRETCETAGDMEANLTAEPVVEPPRPRFPYANWGPEWALLGFVSSLGTGAVFAGVLSLFGLAAAQFGFELGF